jgi:hypothetical protein
MQSITYLLFLISPLNVGIYFQIHLRRLFNLRILFEELIFMLLAERIGSVPVRVPQVKDSWFSNFVIEFHICVILFIILSRVIGQDLSARP